MPQNKTGAAVLDAGGCTLSLWGMWVHRATSVTTVWKPHLISTHRYFFLCYNNRTVLPPDRYWCESTLVYGLESIFCKQTGAQAYMFISQQYWMSELMVMNSKYSTQCLWTVDRQTDSSAGNLRQQVTKCPGVIWLVIWWINYWQH